MATKIELKEKVIYPSYFEVRYIFILNIPADQLGKESELTTKEVAGIASYGLGISDSDIQRDMESRYTKAQDELNHDTKLDLWGKTWDGEVWK